MKAQVREFAREMCRSQCSSDETPTPENGILFVRQAFRDADWKPPRSAVEHEI
jgi:hypothetical protein